MSVLKAGDKVHAGRVANYDGQARRAFIGLVEEYEGGIARVRGRSWLFDPMEGVYKPKQDERVRLISVRSGRYVFNVLPPETDLGNLHYEMAKDGRLFLTDGGSLSMDVSEGDVRRGRAHGPHRRV